MRKSWGLTIGAAVATLAALSPSAAFAATAAPGHLDAPAATGPTVNTTTTFTVSSGALTITAPDTADLGSGAPGTTISGSLGTVTVTDNRALLTAAWTATSAAADFTTGAGTTNETIPATDASYTVGAITTTGTITASGSNVSMTNAPKTVVAGSAGVGDNTASWNPTIAVAVPASAVGGLYTGTITHSVA
jgi:hypothetical protein